MTSLLNISRGIDAVVQRIGRWVQWLTLAMVGIACFNAIARYLGRFIGWDLSSNAFIEGQWYLFSLVFLLGASYTLQKDKHVRVDVFISRLSPKKKALIELLGTVFFLIPFCVFVIYVCWSSVINSWAVFEGSADPGGLPRYPLKTVIPFAFLLLLLQGVSQLIKSIGILRGSGDG